MRELITDFMRLYPQPDGSVRIPLGYAGQAPDLEGLTEGERVRFVDPGQLEAEGIVHSENDERTGRCYWYGILPDGRRAIHEIGAVAAAGDA